MRRFFIFSLVCCLLLAFTAPAYAACGKKYGSYSCILDSHTEQYTYSGNSSHRVYIKHTYKFSGQGVHAGETFYDSWNETLRTEECLIVIDPAVPPTCTVSGLSEGKHCALCKGKIVAQASVSPSGHTRVVDDEVAATCTTSGKTVGAHCGVCGETILAQTEIPATGHSMQNTGSIPATCTIPGKTASQTCTVCGYSEGGTVIPATGHNEEIIPGYPATETQTGLTEGKKCSVCGEVRKK